MLRKRQGAKPEGHEGQITHLEVCLNLTSSRALLPALGNDYFIKTLAPLKDTTDVLTYCLSQPQKTRKPSVSGDKKKQTNKINKSFFCHFQVIRIEEIERSIVLIKRRQLFVVAF